MADEAERTPPITDLQVLRAVAHPVRLRLYGLLSVRGPATVGTLASRVGVAVGSVSYHLRQLARYGFVRPDAQRAANGRESWWRAVPGGIRWSVAGLPDTVPATQVHRAAWALVYRERAAQLAEYLEHEADWPLEWRSATWSTDSRFRLSPAELDELTGELQAVMSRWSERRLRDDDSARDGREYVYLLAYAFPYQP